MRAGGVSGGDGDGIGGGGGEDEAGSVDGGVVGTPAKSAVRSLTMPDDGSDGAGGGGRGVAGGSTLLNAAIDAIVSASEAFGFVQVSLVWKGLTYTVPNPAHGVVDGAPREKTLLRGCTGWAMPGELTALMGASGAGKTTLMDCLAGRKTVGTISGELLVNGRPKNQARWSRLVGYVEQSDVHSPAQTVIEGLLFSARLRLPGTATDAQVQSYVEDAISAVNLWPHAHTHVGMPGAGGAGLSAEQRKRFSIANELVANPSVVFMDEPMSGLDAAAAAIVVRVVRSVANAKRSVVVTIHQPSMQAFEAFDALYLLQRGGHTIYFGSIGAASASLVSHMTGVAGGPPPPPPGVNPATWVLEVTGAAPAVVTAKGRAKDKVDWVEAYKSSELGALNEATANALAADAAAAEAAEAAAVARSGSAGSLAAAARVHQQRRYAAGTRTQVAALMRKYGAIYWRTPQYNFLRFITTAVVAVFCGTIYFRIGQLDDPTSSSEIDAVIGVIYLTVSFLGMANMLAVLPLVAFERVVYYREQAASYYNPWAYVLVISVIEVPYQLVQVVLYVAILYPLLGLKGSAEGVLFYLAMMQVTLMFYVAFGMALAYSTPSQQLAQVFGSGVNFLWQIFNGYVISYPDMAPGWRWLNRIAPTTWVIYGLVADQLAWRQGRVQVTGIGAGDPGTALMTTQEYVQEEYGYSYTWHFWTLLIVAAFAVFFRVVSALMLRYVSFLKR